MNQANQKAIRWLPIFGLLLFWTTNPTYAIITSNKNVPCPHSEGEICHLMEITSYGGYIYDYYPDILNQVFWPYTEKEWLVSCISCKWAVFRNDFEKIKDLPREKIENLPDSDEKELKLLHTMPIIGATKEDTAFIIRWILQKDVLKELDRDSLMFEEIELATELSNEKKGVEKNVYTYLVGRYNFLLDKKDTARTIFEKLAFDSLCNNRIRKISAEHLLNIDSKISWGDDEFYDNISRYLFEEIGLRDDITKLDYLTHLVRNCNADTNKCDQNDLIIYSKEIKTKYLLEGKYQRLIELNSKTSPMEDYLSKLKRKIDSQPWNRKSPINDSLGILVAVLAGVLTFALLQYLI